MPAPKPDAPPFRPPPGLWLVAALFFAATTADSWFRWATFQYRTFDLAFYVQSIWLLLRGQFHASLLNVPLMGNHAEPLAFLTVPLFAIWPHPMLFVIVQNAALATMPFTGWRIARRLGLSPSAALALAAATVLAPATGFVALHEFHPEAFSAPLLLLLIEARMAGSVRRFWLWFLAAMACKENVALLLVAFCAVHACLEWRNGWRQQWRWNIFPMMAAAGWVLVYGKILSPLWNAGNVDYTALYSHLGGSGPEIVAGFFTRPAVAAGALWNALSRGNLAWGLLLPLLALPVLRPRWLLVGAPVLLQHLLSWRESEWTIHFHYAAPLIPLCWMAAAETLRPARRQTAVALAVLASCVAAQAWMGPARSIGSTITNARSAVWSAGWKRAMLAKIPRSAPVTAGLPYLSHLAAREDVRSLHHVLKGLRTLSRERYKSARATDFVVVDYDDTATFDPQAGYYHPRMRTIRGELIPSSDRLFHEFLATEPADAAVQWTETNCNSLSILEKQAAPLPDAQTTGTALQFDATTSLDSVTVRNGPIRCSRTSDDLGAAWGLTLRWHFTGARERFPWMVLALVNGRDHHLITRGLCAPADRSAALEEWSVLAPPGIPGGTYRARLLFYDNACVAEQSAGSDGPRTLMGALDLGNVQVEGN